METVERIWNLLPLAVAFATVTWLYARARKRVSSRRHRPLEPESHYSVLISDTQLAIELPDGTLERVEIDQIEQILVRTTGAGPWAPDFWWEFYTKDGLACRFPEGATGQEAAMDLASRMPGFAFELLNSALASTQDAEFLCWQRPLNQHASDVGAALT